jgi:hypothetical protein
MPLDSYLEAQAPMSRGGVAATSCLALQSMAAPLPVAGPAQGDFDHWRPPMQHGAAADALELQSADAALLASASRRAFPHGATPATLQDTQAQQFRGMQPGSAAEFARPPNRSKVLLDVHTPAS